MSSGSFSAAATSLPLSSPANARFADDSDDDGSPALSLPPPLVLPTVVEGGVGPSVLPPVLLVLSRSWSSQFSFVVSASAATAAARRSASFSSIMRVCYVVLSWWRRVNQGGSDSTGPTQKEHAGSLSLTTLWLMSSVSCLTIGSTVRGRNQRLCIRFSCLFAVLRTKDGRPKFSRVSRVESSQSTEPSLPDLKAQLPPKMHLPAMMAHQAAP